MAVKLLVHGLDKQSIVSSYRSKIEGIFNSIKNGNAEGIEMTGWIDWVNQDHSELVKKALDLKNIWVKEGVKNVLILGTGGSYIGCRAAIEYMGSLFPTNWARFIFVPYFSDRYLCELKEYLEKKNERFAILVISKSGTTLEISVAFRILREILYKKEGENYKKFVAAITDKSKGILRDLVSKNDLISFVIEDSIGGRYSALTAVGLVPMILSGIDASLVLKGARQAYMDHFVDGSVNDDSPALYAAIRNYLFLNNGLSSECLCCYDPNLRFLLEKMKQLFSESEGKKGNGLMPVVMDFTPDLHSVGQLIQDGNKSFFETNVIVKKPKYDLFINRSLFSNDDQLDWIEGKSLAEINRCAFEGTLGAHVNDAKIVNLILELDSWNEESFGYMYYWLSLAAMYSSYMFGVNPFNQPGVEIYKKRMFSLLGRE